MTLSPLAALLISCALAAAGRALRALTPAGAITATGVGSLILLGTGWPGCAALGAFFAGASAISRLAPDRTSAFEAKGAERDAWQVVANGGAAALGALVPEAGLWLVTASLSAAAADTWATSVGGWSRRPPRHLLTWRIVPPGTSGGVTWLGTTGAAAGALLVSGATRLSLPSGEQAPGLGVIALVLGLGGMLLDSALGATLQGRFHCDACDRATERPRHRCGSRTRQVGGLRWLTNDGVNAVATGAAALAGWLAWRLLA